MYPRTPPPGGTHTPPAPALGGLTHLHPSPRVYAGTWCWGSLLGDLSHIHTSSSSWFYLFIIFHFFVVKCPRGDTKRRKTLTQPTNHNSLLASLVNLEMLSTVRLYVGNAIYGSSGVRNCRMLICKCLAFFVIDLISMLIRSNH